MLKINNLNKSFNNKKVLKNINLDINKLDVVAIIGPSGCGKSTLLRCINLLEKPDSGSIVFENKNIMDDNIDLSYIRKDIGMVFQSFNLFNNMNVLNNIIFAPLKLKIMNKESAIKEAKKLLKRFNLSDKINSYPSELSGGEKQRVAIIRTIMLKPKIILFDEPTSALDPKMVGEVEEVIKSIIDDGITAIIVSHEMNFIKNIATKVVYMRDGEIICTGTPKDIFDNPQDEELKKFINYDNF